MRKYLRIFNHGVSRSITEFHRNNNKKLHAIRLCRIAKLRVLRGLFSSVLALAFFFLPACSSSRQEAPNQTATAVEQIAVEQTAEAAAEESAGQKLPSSRFVLIPESARPGEPVTVGYSGVPVGGDFQAILLDPRGRRLTKAAFFDLLGEPATVSAFNAAILAVPSTAISGSAFICIEADGKIIQELPFTIESREFHSETIHLNPQNTELRTVPDPQKTAESEQLWAILSRTGQVIFTQKAFIVPVESTRRTSAYGSRRIYQYSNGTSDTTIHAGVDIGAPTGTEIMACGQGRVVLARERIITGNTVVLEHLPGLYSLYYHLDSIAVSEGAIVGAGAIIGTAGSTGLATGPHLHWEIRVSGENADPDAFLARPVLDKNNIIDKLTEL